MEKAYINIALFHLSNGVVEALAFANNLKKIEHSSLIKEIVVADNGIPIPFTNTYVLVTLNKNDLDSVSAAFYEIQEFCRALGVITTIWVIIPKEKIKI